MVDEAVADTVFALDIGRVLGIRLDFAAQVRDINARVMVFARVLEAPDIFEQLLRPGRDPREDLPLPLLRSDVLSMEALQKGMILSGTVRNVVDFGAFIDIGVKQDGLLHRSQVPRGHILSVGDILDVEILSVEIERGRIGLGWVVSQQG